MNVLWSGTDNPNSLGSDFVINEVASYCGSELVGPILGRIPSVYGNSFVLGFEYWEGGNTFWVTGDPGAPWNQYHANWMMGATITGASTVGGTQREARLSVEYRDNFAGFDPAWWVAFQGQWIGYLDVDEANFAQLDTGACSFNIYGEAFDGDHETNPWMDADMGSGEFAVQSGFSQNYGDVAYFRKPLYYAAKNAGSPTWASGGTHTDPFCYNARNTTDGTPSASWSPTFFFGGTGGDGPLCTTDPNCNTGIANGTACCALSCGTCGGTGCSSRPGGAAGCCTSNINSSGINCSGNRPPCKM